MRTRTILIGALLLASAGLAQAQDQQQQTTAGQTTATAQTPATPAASFVPKYGQVDFGFRGDSLSGDESRYNRFRDLRNGVFVDRFQLDRETETSLFRAEANNVGYRDQRYFGEFQSIGRLKASFEWNQIPLFLANQSRSLYTDSGNGVLTIDDGIQQTLQAAVALGNTARDLALKNALGNAKQFDLRSRRDVGAFNMVYTFNRDVDLKLAVTNTNRSGNQVMAFGFGTSPGLNPAVELGVPLDDRTTDVKGALEFANAKGLLSVGYNGSWYDNSVQTVRFDNPLRASDISAGPSVGQVAWWPTNQSVALNVNGSYKLAKRTRASAAVSIGRWSQDEDILPPTVNTALVSPPLERATAETKANIRSMVFNLNSRPVNNVSLTAKYRYYDYDNKTPHFTATDAIIGDWAAGTQIHETEPASFKRKTMDLDASFTPHAYVAFGLGYGREDAERTFRIFEKTADDTFRVTVDSTGNDYFSVRAKYERSSRTGSGFEEHLLEEVGEQPGTRHYDIADRDRTRVTTMFTVTPMPYLNLNASVGTGKDEYTSTGFGLRDNDNTNWSVGFDAAPGDIVSLGLNYGYEKFKANQYSRTANPLSATNLTFLDETRDWSIDSDDVVKTTSANLDLIKALPKTDIRMSLDLSDGKATYIYGGPAVTNTSVFPTAQLTQLQPVKNRLTMGRLDVQHFVRSNVALGVGYHYEQYKVEDFALSTDTVNQLDARNGTTGVFASTIYAGYLFRPYTANTWWLRMTYLW
jgi:MtrB/PioB family decaheme-associated outer membrane protein